jgi:hypothetical protein
MAATLRSWARRHRGETALVVGNGPSLARTPLDVAAGVPSFGTNRIFLAADTLGFVPTYYLCANRLVVAQSRAEISKLTMPRFLPARSRHEFPADLDITWFRSHPTTLFSKHPDFYGFFEGSTITFIAMQLAYFMGFRRLLLVGVDHRFAQQGPAHMVTVGNGPDPNHFDPRYFSNGFQWQLPDLEASERAFHRAKRVFERAGGEIVDCTIDGALRVFRRSELARELTTIGSSR